jgi:TIR domain
MPGRNRYLDVKSQYANLRESFEKHAGLEIAMASRKSPDPCIFLSHRSSDKAAVRKIGEYITSKGIDVYLDADDPNLQRADLANDHKAITAAIELGIANSTDLLAYLTINTASSPWVPYEIGFAKRSGNHLAAMKSKELTRLPSYLEIVRQITGIASLNAYLREVLNRQRVALGNIDYTRGIILEQLKQASVGGELSAYLDAS